LIIGAGATVTNTRGSIGYYGSGAISEATVTGADATWTNSGELNVGVYGSGRLQIENGGKVSNTYSVIGYISGSTGEVNVTGAGSMWTNSSNLHVGGLTSGTGGTGLLTIADGGLVVVNGATKLWSSGTVTLDGGTLDTRNFDASLGTFNFIKGTLRVAGTTTFAANTTLNIGANSTFVNASGTAVPVTVTSGGLVTGTGSFANLTVHAGGIVSPGNSPGMFDDGDDSTTIWNGGGSYLWEINQLAVDGGTAGANPGWDLWDAGELTVGATVNDPFTIRVRSLDSANNNGQLVNWDPASDHQWLIATATNAGGIFDSIVDSLSIDATEFVTQNGDANFELFADDNGSELWLKYTAPSETGDHNGDGLVDAADYVTWRKGNGIDPSTDDYNIWRSNFGRTVSGGGATSDLAIPEPSTASLTFIAAIYGLARRRITYGVVRCPSSL
jgi:T5SS/PEP-CTERM-associated repeat protein